MTNIYDIITKIKDHMRANPMVNYVNFGNVLEVALDKTTVFPLTHFNLGQTTVSDQTMTISLDFLFLDIVDVTKEYSDTDLGSRDNYSNIIDVYNTQLQVANYLISHLKRGDLYTDQFQLVGDPVCTPFKDRFEHELAGWAVTLSIEVPNNISVCQ